MNSDKTQRHSTSVHPTRVVLASLEFAATFVVGVPLFLGGALYFALTIFVREFVDMYVRAASLWRARVRIADSASALRTAVASVDAAKPAAGSMLSEGQGRFRSWLN
ncbi:MAG: hypothetical protein WA789_20345 [Candidatus Acidiferrum sp.]